MKKKDFRQLKTKEIEELKKMYADLVLQSLKIKAKIAASQEKNVKAFANLKRDIARISTLIREKEIIEKLQPKVGDKKEKKS